MSKRQRKNGGFTLVELIIVAVILAILALVVVPQFSDAGTHTQISSTKASLQTIRSQLELYKVQHNFVYPKLATWSDQMTKKTDPDGTVSATGEYGPYLTKMPINPVDEKSDLAATQDGAGGWAYDEDGGAFSSNDASVLDAGTSETINL